MLPFVDIHVHLLAGLDDGPRTPEDALALCEMAVADGVGTAAGLAHQGDGWPENTPDRIRAAAAELREQLAILRIPLDVFPSAEWAVSPDYEADWERGRFLTVGDRNRYTLVELPAGVPVDPRPIADFLLGRRLTPIFAHVERYPNLLNDEGLAGELVRMGCIFQVNAPSVAAPPDAFTERTLRDWLKRNLVQIVASDGHSPKRRPPTMRAAFDAIESWGTPGLAERVCCLHGRTIVHDLPWRPLPVMPRPAKGFFGRLFSTG